MSANVPEPYIICLLVAIIIRKDDWTKLIFFLRTLVPDEPKEKQRYYKQKGTLLNRGKLGENV
jgi:hypothetical protein